MNKFKCHYILLILSLVISLLAASCINVNMPATKESSQTTPAGGQENPPAQTTLPTNPPATTTKPVVISFAATPDTITQGNSSILTWTVQGATSVTIDQGVGSVALTGARTVSPIGSTFYTLIATNDAGSAPAAVQITVTAPIPAPVMDLPTISYFSASPTSILSGSSSTLSWSVSNASSVVISGIGAVGTSGSYVVSPTTTTAYTLTAYNPAGWRYTTTAVTVTYLLHINPDLLKKIIVSP
jgi:hypothetical protein